MAGSMQDRNAQSGGDLAGGNYADGATGSTQRDAIERLNSALRGEISATETYRQALDKIRDEYGHDSTFQQLAQMHRDHQDAVGELRNMVQSLGGTPSNDSGAWGTLSNTVMGAARVLGDRAALSALASGERTGIEDYQQALRNEQMPDAVRHSLRSLLVRTQEHLQRLEQMIEAV